MSTKMSTDIIQNRPSTRLHEPPGGKSTISFGDQYSTTPAPMSSTPINSPAKVVKARNLDDEIPISMDYVEETVVESSNEVKVEAISKIGVIIASSLTEVQNTVSTAIVRSLVAEGIPVTDITITYIDEALSLPYAVQKVQNSYSVIIASAVLFGVDANTNVNLISASLYQLGLNGNKHIIPAIVCRESLLETKAMVPLASSGWAKAAVSMLNLSTDLPVVNAQEPELREVDIKNSLAKKFTTESSDTQILMANLRVTVAQHGARGIHGLSRKFKIIDDDNSATINFAEFTKFINEHAMHWTLAQVKAVFDYFDTDKSGGISFNEFLIALRGEINDRRKQMILLAFEVLDHDKSGAIELNDIVAKYDASKHPDVIAGKRTKESVLKEFLETFDGNKDGSVTPIEFIQYYQNVSSSIDDDDYFELMIRNAWHISGGEGWCENSSCRRVLVVHTDGRQTVEEIKNDMGIKDTDINAMIANLAAQGITDVASIEVKGSTSSSSEPPVSETKAPEAPKSTESKSITPPQPPTAMPPQPYGRRGAKGGQSSIVFG